MPNDTDRNIYRTLAYFAFFNYPLTAFEVWKWLLEPNRITTLAEVIDALEHSAWLRDRVQSKTGFFALHDIEEAVRERHVRLLDAMRKYHKVLKAVQLFGRLPWVEGVAVCNSLAWNQTNEQSDIDLFLVAAPGRIWTVRLLATLPMMLFRQRPGEGRVDPICLSFFATPDALDFEKLKFGPSDPYLAYWCRSLVPLVDHSGWMERFEMANPWLRDVLPNAQFVRRAHRMHPHIRLRLPRIPLSEKLAKQMQMDRFPQTVRHLMNKDTRVIVSEEMLKFHDQDRREEILMALREKMATV